MAYEINYNDERLQEVETDKQAAEVDLEQTFAGMTEESDAAYNAQIDATKQWETQQSAIQQEQTDFAIEQIEQQKDKAHKDYIKEQSGAYADWQKQTDAYGVTEEQQAAMGMSTTGYSESAQASMYNQYQNRVAIARQSYQQAVLDYDNAIKDARLQNNAALADIAFQSLQTRLTLALEGLQYKNDLLLEQFNQKTALDDRHYNRYLDVLDQINNENALALQEQQLAEQQRQWQAEYDEGVRQFNEEIARLKAEDEKAYALDIMQLEIAKQQFAEEMDLKYAQLGEEQRQFDAENGGGLSIGTGSGTGLYIGGNGGSVSNPTIELSNINLGNERADIASAIQAGNTANAKAKQNQLSRMSGRLSDETAIANYIVAYVNNGTINTNEAAYLLDYFGFKVADYFE